MAMKPLKSRKEYREETRFRRVSSRDKIQKVLLQAIGLDVELREHVVRHALQQPRSLINCHSRRRLVRPKYIRWPDPARTPSPDNSLNTTSALTVTLSANEGLFAGVNSNP